MHILTFLKKLLIDAPLKAEDKCTSLEKNALHPDELHTHTPPFETPLQL